MDARVEAVVMTANAVILEVETTVELISDIQIIAPVVSRFYSCPVISVGGTSISSITPDTLELGDKAIA